jgi:hypothetical protein
MQRRAGITADEHRTAVIEGRRRASALRRAARQHTATVKENREMANRKLPKPTTGTGRMSGQNRPGGSTATQKVASQPAAAHRSPNPTKQSGDMGEAPLPVTKHSGKAE